VRRVVSIWQSGEAFERAGGKRERGLLFLGAPGTGKTMLAKALATGFNSPFISIPGSGFAATFIGIDAIVVRILARRAKRLARKWGGQCIVFIDEIDAVGMRRSRSARAPGRSSPIPGPLGHHLGDPRDPSLARSSSDRGPRRSGLAFQASERSTTSCSPAAWEDWAADSPSISCSSSWTASTTRR
jgi:SpoVK/Ycf46/Vps4 family AAA+-type ATPase